MPIDSDLQQQKAASPRVVEVRSSLRYMAGTKPRAVRIAVMTVALFATSSAYPQAYVPRMCDVSLGIDLQFAPAAVALEAFEREKVGRLVERINGANFCPFAGLNIQGHVDPGEVPKPATVAISLARAQYVASLFERSGIPKSLLNVEAKGDKQPVMQSPDRRNSRVEAHVYAGCASLTCSFPVGPNGLRLPN